MKRLTSIGVFAAVGFAAVAYGAADITFREFQYRHVCDRGPTPGVVCCAADECGEGGTCAVDAIGKVSALFTMVIDNDVSGLDGTKIPGSQVRAFTTILEVKGKNGPLLAQTFQNLEVGNLLDGLTHGPQDEFGFEASEGQLDQEIDPTTTGIPIDVTFLIYRTLDAETVNQMRANAGLLPGGPEILVVQPSKLKLQRYVKHWSPTIPNDPLAPDNDPFAGVLRVKLSAYFVAKKPDPPEPPCF